MDMSPNSESDITAPATPSPLAGKVRILYWTPELGDPACRKRVCGLRLAGASVHISGFNRLRGPANEARPDDLGENVVLGHTRNGDFRQRIAALLAALVKIPSLKPTILASDLMIARNLEMLFLAFIAKALARSKAALIYECLDLHRLMLGQGPVSRLLRWVERVLLAQCHMVLTSSPAYISQYFRKAQAYRGAVYLVENKMLRSDLAKTPFVSRPQTGQTTARIWRIAYCGVLRCKASLAILDQLTRCHEGRLSVDIWGKPAFDQIPDFDPILERNPFLRFHGPYEPADLARIYADADFAWAVDYYEEGGNSDWLLPNRLYESLSFGAIPIVRNGTQMARWLEQYGLKTAFGEPFLAQLDLFFQSLRENDVAELRAQIAAIPSQDLTEDARSYRELIALMMTKSTAQIHASLREKARSRLSQAQCIIDPARLEHGASHARDAIG